MDESSKEDERGHPGARAALNRAGKSHDPPCSSRNQRNRTQARRERVASLHGIFSATTGSETIVLGTWTSVLDAVKLVVGLLNADDVAVQQDVVLSAFRDRPEDVL